VNVNIVLLESLENMKIWLKSDTLHARLNTCYRFRWHQIVMIALPSRELVSGC